MSATFENLRRLYKNYGYSRYKMGKFEEYDFYTKNKQSLISQGVLTFTDVNGKLMALKPDVTLSIIKHIREIEGLTQKFFYDEKVYRISKNDNAFKEITQIGIEAAGYVNDYVICEVLELALKSLEIMAHGRDYVLDVSDLGILKNFIPEDNSHEILNLIAAKNIDELKKFPDVNKNLIELVKLKPDIENLEADLKNITGCKIESEKFSDIINNLKSFGRNINIDFSTVNDMNYYNGIIFKGYISGIPECVLSGGQYDILIQRMGYKNSRAIGFAVYADLLNKIGTQENNYDADVLIIYDENISVSKITACVQKYINQNLSVCVQKIIPDNFKYRELVKLNA